MASDTWKSWEREVARDLGGKRTGPTGLGMPDVIDLPVPFAPECKYGALSLRSDALAQAEKNARGKPWGLFLREKRTGKRLVVLEYKLFLQFWDAYVRDTTR